MYKTVPKVCDAAMFIAFKTLAQKKTPYVGNGFLSLPFRVGAITGTGNF